MVKAVTYGGVVYRRYPGRLYYNPGGGGTSLHRRVWLDAGREIPPGWHIHHLDGDHDNNTLGNLACLPPNQHARQHIVARLAGELGERLAAWRSSPVGQRTLRDNARKMRAHTPLRTPTCRTCGAVFETRHPRRHFCSTACQTAAGYILERVCPICGKAFRAKPNNVRPTATCSYRCGWALRRSRAGLQPDS